jgi:uncharacterized protein YjbI with pentapeptide repeats
MYQTKTRERERDKMNIEHVTLLKKSVLEWNTWRSNNPDIIPDLTWADLTWADLTWADLSKADLTWADLSKADLTRANLSKADLTRANLTEANLSEANLSWADLDFSSGLTLWCKSFNITLNDNRLLFQLCYHICKLNGTTKEFQVIKNVLKPFANQFHRANECGKID